MHTLFGLRIGLVAPFESRVISYRDIYDKGFKLPMTPSWVA